MPNLNRGLLGLSAYYASSFGIRMCPSVDRIFHARSSTNRQVTRRELQRKVGRLSQFRSDHRPTALYRVVIYVLPTTQPEL
jgi:hypothetical protein